MGMLSRMGGKYKAYVRRMVRTKPARFLPKHCPVFQATPFIWHERADNGPASYSNTLCGRATIGDGPHQEAGRSATTLIAVPVTCNYCQRIRIALTGRFGRVVL